MRTIPIHYKSFIIIFPFEEKRNTIFLYMSLNPPIRKNNRKEAVSRTQRHDKQPPESGKRPRCFAHKNTIRRLSAAILSFPFQGEARLSSGNYASKGKARAFLHEPCARLGALHSAVQAQYHRHTALRYFCSETWKGLANSSVFNCALILAGNRRAVNMRHLFSQCLRFIPCVSMRHRGRCARSSSSS